MDIQANRTTSLPYAFKEEKGKKEWKKKHIPRAAVSTNRPKTIRRWDVFDKCTGNDNQQLPTIQLKLSAKYWESCGQVLELTEHFQV